MGIVFSFIFGIAIGFGVFRYSVEPKLANGKQAVQIETNEITKIPELTPTPVPVLGNEKAVTVTQTLLISSFPSATPTASVSPSGKPAVIPSSTPKITVTLVPSTHPPSTTPTINLTITPIPTEEPITAPPQFDSFFNQYAEQYKIDANLLKKIAKCESDFNNNAIGLDGLYIGMFQFNATTWINLRKQMGLDSNPDIRFGGQESIQTAAYAMSLGRHTSLWPTCSK